MTMLPPSRSSYSVRAGIRFWRVSASVEGVVSALHHVPTSVVWLPEEIAARQALIGQMKDGTPSTLRWDVVESLPVSEDIKKQKGAWREHIANWKTSMTNLSRAEIEVICYNFMPVLDWTRTALHWRLAHGGIACHRPVPGALLCGGTGGPEPAVQPQIHVDGARGLQGRQFLDGRSGGTAQAQRLFGADGALDQRQLERVL